MDKYGHFHCGDRLAFSDVVATELNYHYFFFLRRSMHLRSFVGCKNNVWTFPAYAEVANFIMPNTLPVFFSLNGCWEKPSRCSRDGNDFSL